MERMHQRLGRDRNDGLRKHRSDLIGSKMKAEKLKSTLHKLKDDERKSKHRNETLIHEFDKVNNMAENLETKARKLKKLKKDYETYIHAVYPQWKENMDVSRNVSPRTPDEEMQFTSFHEPINRHHGSTFNSTGPLHSTAIQLSSADRTLHASPRLNSGNHKWNFETMNSHDKYPPEVLREHASSCIDGGRNSMNYSSGQNQSRPSQGFGYSTTQMDQHMVPPYYDNGYKVGRMQSSTNPVQGYYDPSVNESSSRPNFLGIPKIDQNVDISKFTVLPQALALSPDGQLVLLPMALSPHMQSFESRERVQTDLHSSNRGDMDSVRSNDLETSRSVGEKLVKPVTKLREERTLMPNGFDNEVSIREGSFAGKQSRFKDFADAAQGDQPVNGFKSSEKERQLSYSSVKDGSRDQGNDSLGHDSPRHQEMISGFEMVKDGKGEVTQEKFTWKNLKKEIKDTDTDEMQIDLGRSSSVGSVDDHQESTQAGEVKSARPFDDDNQKVEHLEISNLPGRSSPLSDQKSSKEEPVPNAAEDEEVISCVNEVPKLLSVNPDFENIDSSAPDVVEAENNCKAVVSNEQASLFPDLEKSAHQLPEESAYEEEDKRNAKSTEKKSDGRTAANSCGSLDVAEETVTVVDMPGISHLYEEIEKRMGVDDRKEFYRSSPDSSSSDVLNNIRRVLSVEGDLSPFKTSDLCTVSKLVTVEYVENNSENSCIVKNDSEMSLIYSLDGFREIVSPEFEELWEYIFNHMELLFGNMIFESTSVCQIFSQILCPGSSEIAFELSNALQRIMDGGDDDYYDESAAESAHEEESRGSSAADERRDPLREDTASPEQENSHEEIEEIAEIESSHTTSVITSERDGQSPQSDVIKVPGIVNESLSDSPVHGGTSESQKTEENAKEASQNDNLLDIGSVSDVSDDDDSSTFDSTKLTPRKIPENTTPNDNKNVLDISSTSDPTESEVSSPGRQKEEVAEMKEEVKTNTIQESIDEDSDSGDDLDDLLSGSLGINKPVNETSLSARSTNAEGQKNRALFKKKQDSFEVDDPLPVQKKGGPSTRKDVLSPENSKSISSKFRKPGFWENSDSESEAGDLNISGGNDLSARKDDDEFDFDFFN